VKAGTFIYYKLSHLKPDSVEVKVGDTIKEGQALAKCGNSGRSPYPHLHFQIQQTPYIGSPTLRYAISNYLLNSKQGRSVMTYDFPLLGQNVENVYPQRLLKNALQFKPGQRLQWQHDGEIVIWEVKITIYNQTYLECMKTGSRAWFDSGSAVFWFTHFEGSRNSLLYLFFLALFKVPLVFEAGLNVKDEYPINLVFSKLNRWVQDLVAPFRVYLSATYHLQFQKIDDPTFPSLITVKSSTSTGRRNKKIGNFAFEINNQGIRSFQYQWKNKQKQIATCKY
jgi:hypothetical protein